MKTPELTEELAVYSKNEYDHWEECWVAGVDRESGLVRVDFGRDIPIQLRYAHELQPACENCGGMKSDSCCDDPDGSPMWPLEPVRPLRNADEQPHGDWK